MKTIAVGGDDGADDGDVTVDTDVAADAAADVADGNGADADVTDVAADDEKIHIFTKKYIFFLKTSLYMLILKYKHTII